LRSLQVKCTSSATAPVIARRPALRIVVALELDGAVTPRPLLLRHRFVFVGEVYFSK
jgi:hypothetical protein